MFKRNTVLRLVLFMSLLLICGGASAEIGVDQDGTEYVPNQIIIKFSEDVGPKAHKAFKMGFATQLNDSNADVLDELMNQVNAVSIRRLHKSLEDENGQLKMTARERMTRQLTKRLKRPIRRQNLREKLARIPDLENIFIVEISRGMEHEAFMEIVTALGSTEWIEWAEPNYLVSVDATPLPVLPYVPTDNYITQDGLNWSEGSVSAGTLDQYGLRNIRAIEGWNVLDTNMNGIFDGAEIAPGESPDPNREHILVAVIDSGLDVDHPDIAATVWVNPYEDLNSNGVLDVGDINFTDDDPDGGNGFDDDVVGWDFGELDNDVYDQGGHGTHVAGIVGAPADGIGMVGVAPYVKVLPIKSFQGDGGATSAASAQAVNYAVTMGADIISASWGSKIKSSAVEASFIAAKAAGVLSIAAAGNSGADQISYPAGLDSVMAVANVDHQDIRATLSTYGDFVDVAAPGVQILSLCANDGQNNIAIENPGAIVDAASDYIALSGTSMSCPHVSGAAAVLMSYFPGDDAIDIWRRLWVGADDIENLNPDYAGKLGWGRINVLGSMGSSTSPIIELDDLVYSNMAVGENSDLTVYLRNDWKDAVNVQGTLVSLSSDVTVLSGNSSFGDVPREGFSDNSLSPFVVSFSPDTAYRTTHNLELTVSDDSGYSKVIPLSFYFPIFEDISEAAGLPSNHVYVGNPFIHDFNGDDLPDVGYRRSGLNFDYHKQEPDNTFPYVPYQPGGNGGDYRPLFVDIDNDGHKDVFLAGGSRYDTWLFLNDGAGGLIDITASSGINTAMSMDSAIAIDVDSDSDLDIVGDFRHVLRNNGDNTFTEIVDETGLSAVDANSEFRSFDYDLDGDQDLAVTPIPSPSGVSQGLTLWRNDAGVFTDITSAAFPLGVPAITDAGLALGDYDNDGDMDIFTCGNDISTNGASMALYRNNGDGTFEDVIDSTGDLAISNIDEKRLGNEFFDFDNDGDLDLYVTSEVTLEAEGFITPNRNSLFRNNGDGTFSDITELSFNEGISIRADASFGDINRDGLIDIFSIARGGSYYYPDKGGLLQNALVNGNSFLQIQLVSTQSASGGHGARISVESGLSSQVREVRSSTMDPDFVHFGLNSNVQTERIEVRWPSGIVQVLNDIPANQRRVIVETAQDCAGSGDDDGDGICNDVDNCIVVANGIHYASNQVDSDRDGFGNACDADYDNDGVAGTGDFGILNQTFGSSEGDANYNPNVDHNGDRTIDEDDFDTFLLLYAKPIGPSALACADATGATAPCYDQYGAGDTDGDQVINREDNCVLRSNGPLDGSNQIDSNFDGFGNACDPDYNDSGEVNRQDRNIFRAADGTALGDSGYNPDVDHDGDDVIGAADKAIFDLFYGGVPGPSGLTCAGTIPCPEEPSDCGNGVLDPPAEECDGSEFGGATCADYGCAGGALSCTSSCGIDSSGCTDCGPGGCDGDGVCEAGEDCSNCPSDCVSGGGTASCGNGVCEPFAGEDCVSCAQDCNGKLSGKPSNQYCCGDLSGAGTVSCGDSRCTESGFSCSDAPTASYCCGDAVCEGGEDPLVCEIDCGPPVSGCGDLVCDPGEDCDSCPSDCEGKTSGKPQNQFCCGNGIPESAEGDGTRCDGVF